MDNLTINIADITYINKIVNDTEIDKAIIARWLKLINNQQLILVVAQRNDKYIGRLNIWLAKADEPEINKYFYGLPLINALQINSEERGRGVGTMIMQFAHNYLIKNGYNSVGLGVEPDNIRAIKLYKKLGYKKQKIGNRDTYVSKWDETKPDGTIREYSIKANFYLKKFQENT